VGTEPHVWFKRCEKRKSQSVTSHQLQNPIAPQPNTRKTKQGALAPCQSAFLITD